MTSDAAADATTRANCVEEVASIMTNAAARLERSDPLGQYFRRQAHELRRAAAEWSPPARRPLRLVHQQR